jgi:hypothetical protein
MKYTIEPGSHYSKPFEFFRKFIPKIKTPKFKWEIVFEEDCWFDSTELQDDAKDWNFKVCGITGAFSRNNYDSVMCAVRPKLDEPFKFQATWYLNDSSGKFEFDNNSPLFFSAKEPLIVELNSNNITIYAASNKQIAITKSYNLQSSFYRFIGPSFGGNRKAFKEMTLHVNKL